MKNSVKESTRVQWSRGPVEYSIAQWCTAEYNEVQWSPVEFIKVRWRVQWSGVEYSRVPVESDGCSTI